MSYQDLIDAQRYADNEWDDALQAARENRDVFQAEDSRAKVTVMMRDGLTYDFVPVSLPMDLGKRMNALAEQVVIFYRDAPDRTRRNFVLTARLPDGRKRSVEYPPKSGQYALDRVAELVEWAEREMEVTA